MRYRYFFGLWVYAFFALSTASLVAYGQEIRSSDVSTADSLFIAADYEKAERVYICIASQPGNQLNSYAKARIAECWLKRGNVEKAEKLVKENLNVSGTRQNAYNLEILGQIYMAKGQNDQALKELQKAYEIYTQSKDKKGVASSLNNSGLVYWNTGNKDQALEYLQKALDLRREMAAEDKMSLAGSLNNIGLVYLTDQPEKAESCFRSALAIYSQTYSEVHPSIAACYNNIAIIKRQSGSLQDAKENLLKVKGIWTKIYGPEHPNVAYTMLNLGEIAARTNSTEAKQLYQDAIAIYVKNYGLKHPEIAAAYNLTGELCLEKKEFQNALINYQKALIANVPAFNEISYDKNPGTKSYYNPGVLLSSLISKSEALEGLYFNRTVKLKDLKSALSALQSCDTLIDHMRHTRIKKADKLELGITASEVYENAIRVSLALQDVTGKKSYFEQAFYFAEKSKASVLQEAISESEAKEFANIPADIIDEEKKLKADISLLELNLASSPDPEKEKELRNNLFIANVKHDQFTQSLEQKYPEYFNLKYNFNPAKVSQVQVSLTKQTAVQSYFIADKSQRLYIFRITRDNFKVFDVPKEPELEKQIKGLRNSIIYLADESFVLSSRTLYKQLFPVKLPKEIKKLVIIPDGGLNTIPFEVLLTKKLKNDTLNATFPYLILDYAVSYNLSASLYLQSAGKTKQAASPGNIFLCAPVNFAYGQHRLASLPNTENEVREIAGLFGKKGQNTFICANAEAKETFIKSGKISGYNYLHFATHGLVNEASPELSQIYLCSDTSNKEDGHLYSGEIYNLELNSELVTLSACQTGLGKFTKGEGIIGLTRALLFAGAKNVSVSLWSVADKSTADFMIDFYANLLSGMDKVEAMQASKIKMIREGVKESKGRLNAFYWSPFILIGN